MARQTIFKLQLKVIDEDYSIPQRDSLTEKNLDADLSNAGLALDVGCYFMWAIGRLQKL